MARSWQSMVWAITLALVAVVRLTASGQGPGEPRREAEATRYLGSHHIDRYDAIQQIIAALKADPTLLQDWIILGELAQEVADDAPRAQAPGYYKLARQSFESALKLRPNDANLKAAAEFARQQEAQAETSAQSRSRAASAYLSARRQELSQPGAGPMIRTYEPAVPGGVPTYYYRPYVVPGMQPYTYRQHSEVYDPYSPADVGPIEPRSGAPMTFTERGALVKPGAAMVPP
jgi:hypothetical protein